MYKDTQESCVMSQCCTHATGLLQERAHSHHDHVFPCCLTVTVAVVQAPKCFSGMNLMNRVFCLWYVAASSIVDLHDGFMLQS